MALKAKQQKPALPVLTAIEKEVCILLSAREAIKSMVNKGMLSFGGSSEQMTIRPNDLYNAELFNIFLVDFLSHINPPFGNASSYIEELKNICSSPNFNHKKSIGKLSTAVAEFDKWINFEADFEKIWLPSIEKNINLKMKRIEFIKICGDISKHNFLRLSKTAERILTILRRSEPDLNMADAYSVITEFYEWFHRDIFYYHLTKISELLNNISWGIQAYLKDEYARSYTVDVEKTKVVGIEVYSFDYPSGIENPLGQYHYWGLMNEIRERPWVPEFKTCPYLQGRY